MSKQGSIKHYRQTGANPAPQSLPFGEIAISKDGIIYAGDVNNLPSPQKCNYSLQEHDTGRKWTDGKPIYEKTIVGTLNPTSVNQQTGFNFGLTVNTLVAYSVVGTDGNGYYFGDVGEQENGIAFIRTLFARYIVVFNHFLSVGLAA
ncbi:MAG: hypothetical protein RR573_10310, partial [Oscillospiraceae bacterium]